MKKSLSLTELAARLESRAEAKHDLVVPGKELSLVGVEKDDAPSYDLVIPGQGSFELTENSHQQLASRLQIPKNYYDRMAQEKPELLIDNVHEWLHNDERRHMIRAYSDTLIARAILSDRYRRIDNEQVAQAVFTTLVGDESVRPLNVNVTEKKLYMTFLFPELEAEVKPGDSIHPGIMITNSEIGYGTLAVSYFFYRNFCENGCVFGKDEQFGFKRTHLGGRVLDGVDYQVFTDDTLKQQDRVIMAEVIDTVKAASDKKLFDLTVDKLRLAADSPEIVNPVSGVEVLAKSFGLNESEKVSVLTNLIEDKDYSRWGALNAITKVANNTADYDRATELEQLGSRVIDLPRSEWKQITEADGE